MAFVILTEKDFDEWTKGIIGAKPRKRIPARGRELVLQFKLAGFLEIHVYTTLDNLSISRTDGTRATRQKGADAIRMFLYDSRSRYICHAAKKILRTSGKTTVQERMYKAYAGLIAVAETSKRCPKCGCLMVSRLSSSGKTFDGCSAYPYCPDLETLKKERPYNRFASTRKKLNIKKKGVRVEVPTEPAKIKEEGKLESFPPKVTTTNVKTKGEMIKGEQKTLSEKDRPLVQYIPEVPKKLLTSRYKYIKYPFTHFNRLQSSILSFVKPTEDYNLVIGTGTSTGKTVMAELQMGPYLKNKEDKIIYISPLKALTQEKFDDWSGKFGDGKVCILTGDYTLTPRKAQELMDAKIICMTSEMLDTRTRNFSSERSAWLTQVKLLAVDEAHIIGTGRGHAVEVGVMRFSKLVPQAKVLFLSATIPNIQDFVHWSQNLNAKRTFALDSNWRPIKLEWHFINHIGSGSYIAIQRDKIDKTVSIVMEKNDQKFLCFVHDKATGRKLVAALRAEGEEAEFHSADAGMDKRLEIESAFSKKEGGLRVLVSTSTLAWGRNLPARNVVVVGTTRGIQDVDVLDIIQMAGRAGRLGFDKKGDCYFIVPELLSNVWKRQVLNPPKVISNLLSKELLGFHILAEININQIQSIADVFPWFQRSLAAVQGLWDERMVAQIVHDLQKNDFIEMDDHGHLTITGLGRVSAQLYILPGDLTAWRKTFSLILKDSHLKDNSMALAWAYAQAPSIGLGFVPRNEEERVQDHHFNVMALLDDNLPIGWRKSLPFNYTTPAVAPLDLYEAMCGENRQNFRMVGIKADAERMCTAIGIMNSIFAWVPEKGFFTSLGLRIKYGVPNHLIQLCRLKGVGPARAMKLFDAGITKPKDILDEKNNGVLARVLPGRLKRQVYYSAKDIVENEK